MVREAVLPLELLDKCSEATTSNIETTRKISLRDDKLLRVPAYNLYVVLGYITRTRRFSRQHVLSVDPSFRPLLGRRQDDNQYV